MKRKIAVLLFAVMILTLTACASKPKGTDILTVEKNGQELFVIYNYEKQTISVGKTLSTVYGPDGELLWEEDSKDRYRYEYDGGDITIYYPNGATYWESPTATGAASGWDGDYDTERYVDGNILAGYLEEAYRSAAPNYDNMVVIGLLCLVVAGIGVVQIKHPELLFELRYGLWFNNIEPTDHAIFMARVSGVIAVIAAGVLLLIAAFG